MARTLAFACRVASSDSTLLLLGETGVGKEWIARAIHERGTRARGPFVAINCAALPEQLLESELFGHERGAFTGASGTRRGHFEQADGGTIFLDEIAEMTPHLQAKLLRVLQDRTIQRVGGEQVFQVDVRIVAATSRDHRETLGAGAFRRDLYYRLAVLVLRVPPLRERPEDVAQLAERFLADLSDRLGKPVEGFDAEATRTLCAHDWPGNVRELLNAIERAVLLCDDDYITATDLGLDTQTARPRKASIGAAARRTDEVGAECKALPDGQADGEELWRKGWEQLPLAEVRRRALQSIERRYLEELLRDAGGRVGEVARRAGMTPRSLFDRLKLHGLRKEDFRRSR